MFIWFHLYFHVIIFLKRNGVGRWNLDSDEYWGEPWWKIADTPRNWVHGDANEMKNDYKK